MEKPPLTRRRVTQLSYPITRTDPELSAVRAYTSYDAMLLSVTTLYIPRVIVLQKANKDPAPGPLPGPRADS
jgi:hypothetical protein